MLQGGELHCGRWKRVELQEASISLAEDRPPTRTPDYWKEGLGVGIWVKALMFSSSSLGPRTSMAHPSEPHRREERKMPVPHGHNGNRGRKDRGNGIALSGLDGSRNMVAPFGDATARLALLGSMTRAVDQRFRSRITTPLIDIFREWARQAGSTRLMVTPGDPTTKFLRCS